MSTTPILTAHDGGGMSADDAAWISIAEAAERGLMLPGLSPAGSRLLREAADSCRFAAGMPPRRESYDGETLLNEVFDLIRRRLPMVGVSDPCRAPLMAMMPALAELLDRPLVLPVPASRLRAAGLPPRQRRPVVTA